MCCRLESTPHRIDMQWTTSNSSVYPYTADLLVSISGYVLNNASSSGPVTVRFLRGGSGGSRIAFQFAVDVGVYKSFTVTGVDTIEITADTHFTSGELNIMAAVDSF